MIKWFRKVFISTHLLLKWLISPGILDMSKAGNILTLTFFIWGAIAKYANNELVSRVALGIVGIVILLATYLGYFKFDKVRLPKFLTGGAKTPSEILSRFTDFSFVYGIAIFSLYTSFFGLGVVLMISQFIFGYKLILPDWVLSNLTLCTLALFTIFWFMYHLLFNPSVTVKIIKIKLRFYLAISGTASVIILPFAQELIRPVITYLGIAFTWLAYLIERAELELVEEEIDDSLSA